MAEALVRLAQNPKDADALFVVAAALVKAGDLRGAIRTLERLAIVDETYPGLWILKTKLHAQRGELRDAQESRARMLEVEGQGGRPGAAAGERPPPALSPSCACPSCGAGVASDSLTCPSCGVEFEAEAAPPSPAPRLTGEAAGRSPAADSGRRRRGLTNGLQAGTRRDEGPGNGLADGLVNGRRVVPVGRSNGLTNGTGLTNGLGTPRFAAESRGATWKLYVIPLLATALLVAPLLGDSPDRALASSVDGDFRDWEGVAAHVLSTGARNANVDLTRVAVRADADYVSLLVEVWGLALAGGPDPPGYLDAIFVFVDGDRAATGYPIDGLGADHLVEVQGAGGRVVRSVIRHASPATDPRDWNTWADAAFVPAAAAGSQLELAVPWAHLGDPDAPPAFLVASLGHDGTTDLADVHLGTTVGQLRAVQRDITLPVLPRANAQLLAIDLQATDSVTVSGLTVDLLGTAPSSAIGVVRLVDGTGGLLAEQTPVNGSVPFAFPSPIPLPAGEPATWIVAASASGPDGATLGARIRAPSAVAAGPAVVTLQTVDDDDPLGYIGQIPGAPVVDGGFAEWRNGSADGTAESSTRGNPSVDIDRFAAVAGPTDLTFFVRLQGRAFAGTVLPAERAQVSVLVAPSPDRDRDTVPNAVDLYPDDFDNDGVPDGQADGDVDGDGVWDYPAGGPDWWLNATIPAAFPPPYAGRPVSVYVGPITRPPAIGEDRVRMFVDADNVTATGFSIAGLGADYLIELEGREAVVSRATVSAHDGANPSVWRWRAPSATPIALGGRHLEGRADIALPSPNPVLYFEVSDWRGGRDDAGLGTRGASRSTALGASSAGPGAPEPLDIPGNTAYRLRNTNDAETACTINKVASTTPGAGPAQTATLNAGQTACWYLDATSGATIAAGDWESLLDVRRTTALAFDAVSTGQGHASSISWSHTTVSQTDGLLVVGTSSEMGGGNSVVNAVTYANLPLTKIRHDWVVDEVRTELWYRIGTLSGARTVRVNLSESDRIVAGAISFTGADQTAPIGTNGGATDTSSSPSVTIASAPGEIVVDTVAVPASVTLSVGPDQTERWNLAEGTGNNAVTGGGSTEAGAASVTMSWSFSGPSKPWAISAVAIKPAAVEYDVYLEIWNKATDSVSETIGSCVDVTTYGDDVQCLVAGVPAKTLSNDQVVRLRVRHSSNSGTVSIEFDDADSTGNSRVTIPIPEFLDVAIPMAGAALLAAIVRRRRRRTQSPHR